MTIHTPSVAEDPSTGPHRERVDAGAPSPPASANEGASGSELLELGAGIRIRWTDPERQFSVVRIVRPAPDGSSVTVEERVGRSVMRRTYEREILEDLWRIWGAKHFDVAGWKSELCVGHEVTWHVQTGAHERELCHNQAAITQVAELNAVLQSLMKGP